MSLEPDAPESTCSLGRLVWSPAVAGPMDTWEGDADPWPAAYEFWP